MWTVMLFVLVVCPLSIYFGMKMLKKRREDLIMQRFRFAENSFDMDSKIVSEAFSKVKLMPLGDSSASVTASELENKSAMPKSRR